MIKANELRLGNLLAGRNFNYELTVNVAVLKAIDLFENELPSGVDENTYNPIPLTEEWLLKFGFERKLFSCQERTFVGWGNIISIVINEGKYQLYIDIDDDSWYSFCWTEIKYVHQIQNLFFALTGEELTLK